MSTIVKGILTTAMLLLATAGFAQQDPNDQGAADSIILELSLINGGADGQIRGSILFFNDVQTVVASSASFKWDNPAVVMDSIRPSDEARTAFDSWDIRWWPPHIPWSNEYRTINFVQSRFFSDGLPPSASLTHVADFYFHVESANEGDSLCIELTPYNTTAFVDSLLVEYVPVWRGTVCISLEGVPSMISDNTILGDLPESYALSQNYPNPFNPTTTIDYTLLTATQIELVVLNELGQKVATLASGLTPPGHHQTNWNGRNDHGTPVASGVYLYRLTAGEFVQSRKMLLLK